MADRSRRGPGPSSVGGAIPSSRASEGAEVVLGVGRSFLAHAVAARGPAWSSLVVPRSNAELLIEAALAEFRARLVDAVHQMTLSESPEEFCKAERDVHSLTAAVAADLTQRALQDMSDDRHRRQRALAAVRDRAASKGVELRVERVRKTDVRLLSGATVEVTTPYATGRPRGNGGPLTQRGAPGAGVYPVLDALGIAGRSSPALRLQVSHAVCEANSVSSAREILAFSGTVIDHKAALRLTYMVSEGALDLRARALASPVVAVSEVFAGRRVVATVDGGRVLIRKRTAGRPKAGGRKHFKADWREPKVVTLYVLAADGKRDRSVPPVIDATLGDADAVFALMRYHLLRHGADRAANLTLVGEGAPWIWHRAEALRQAVGTTPENWAEVVDYFHVVERVAELAKEHVHGDDDAGRAWLNARKAELKLGRIEDVERAVAALAYGTPEAGESELAYWARTRERMRYAKLRLAALPLGSGAVESAVRRVVNLRLKGASIVWTEEHAEGMLHLRAHAKSGRWDELERAVLAACRWQPTSRTSRAKRVS